MPFPYAAALAAALSIGGGMAKGNAGLSRRTIRRRGKAVLEQQRPRLLSAYGEARRQTGKALDVVRGGTTNALRATEDAQTTSMRLGMEALRGGQAAVGQRTTSRGLANTSLADADRRSFTESSTRILDEISARGGAARADIYQQGAAREAELLQDLGRLYQMQYSAEASDYFGPLFDIMTGGGGGDSEPLDLSGLYPILEDLFGGGAA